jgi:hypothetical protein
MALLSEYALTPDVFDLTSYCSDEVCALHLQNVKEILLQEGLVRNLRNGEWAKIFSADSRPWHRRGKELLTKLVSQSRLIPHPPRGSAAPISDTDWCDEALISHEAEPFDGIIVTKRIAATYKGQPLVAQIDRLSATPWWTSRSCSLRLRRAITEYQKALDLVLRHANSIMFIDPHLDPSQGHYRDFGRLLSVAKDRSPAPLIEVHRVCYRGSGQTRQILTCSEIEIAFRNALSAPLQAAGLHIDVFIWDDFHDRYLISNLVGIGLPNGFDTTSDTRNVTTWTRLGREDRDDVQREFDRSSVRHKLIAPPFRVPN